MIPDVTDPLWPCRSIEALFAANTLHIMSWANVVIFFERLSATCQQTPPSAYTAHSTITEPISDSNARFDQWLKRRNPLSGIRDFKAVVHLAKISNLELLNDVAMPANNRLLIFNRTKP